VRKRWLRWLAAAGLGLALFAALAGSLSSWLREGPLEDAGDRIGRIYPAMSRAAVRAVMGVPPGDYRTGPAYFLPGRIDRMDRSEETRAETECWTTDAGLVEVVFDGSGRVVATEFTPVDDRGGELNELRWSLKRWWHRRTR
jgi:hypothetical protein